MQTQVATLLLITSNVIFASIVVGFAASITMQTLGTTDNPQIERIQGLQNQLLNQTNILFNQLQNITTNETYNQTLPQEP